MSFDPPKSRNEAILQNMLGANNALDPPKSRVEELLMQLLEQGGTGGGGDIPEDVALLKHLAPPYDSTHVYSFGEYVTYGEDVLQTSSVYKCNQNGVSGNWNADYWTPVSVMDEIAYKLPLDVPAEDTVTNMIVRYDGQPHWKPAPARSAMIFAGGLNSTLVQVLFNVLMPLAKTNGSACRFILVPKSAADDLLTACVNNMMDDGSGIKAYPCFVLSHNDQRILFTLKSGILDNANMQNSTLTFEGSYVKWDMDNGVIDIYKIESNLKCVSASENSILAISVDYLSATALN